MNLTTIGLDIAKNVFQAHGVDQNGGGAQAALTGKGAGVLCQIFRRAAPGIGLGLPGGGDPRRSHWIAHARPANLGDVNGYGA